MYTHCPEVWYPSQSVQKQSLFLAKDAYCNQLSCGQIQNILSLKKKSYILFNFYSQYLTLIIILYMITWIKEPFILQQSKICVP